MLQDFGLVCSTRHVLVGGARSSESRRCEFFRSGSLGIASVLRSWILISGRSQWCGRCWGIMSGRGATGGVRFSVVL